MDKKKLKARHFTFVLYEESIPNDWKEQLESLGVPMAISPLHNLDKKSVETMDDEEKSIVASGGVVYKKAHYHVIYIARNPVTIESVRNKIKRKLGNSSVSHIEIIDY
ncbi:Rep family protein, partial [Limosilactobacillus fermentum]|uniref:Rep family protein n=2 Tax=Lactobacillales TaxID=186826 RepID=UPI001EDE88C2